MEEKPRERVKRLIEELQAGTLSMGDTDSKENLAAINPLSEEEKKIIAKEGARILAQTFHTGWQTEWVREAVELSSLSERLKIGLAFGLGGFIQEQKNKGNIGEK